MSAKWTDEIAISFAQWILKNGDGKLPKSIFESYRDRFTQLEQFYGTHPDIDKVLELARGLTAEEIRRRVLQRMGAHREPLAKRCENAARFLQGASK